MNDLAIAIEIGSPNSTVELVENTFKSLKKNIGECKWKVFLSIGLKIKPELKKFVYYWVQNNSENFEIFEEVELSWAKFINNAIEITSNYEYFIKSHDDIELLTSNFFHTAKKIINEIDKPLGWISFTDISWERGDFGPSVRPGYHLDHNIENWNSGLMFQFNKFPPYWYLNNYLIDKAYSILSIIARMFWGKELKYPKVINRVKNYDLDLPIAPVKCHAPFNHFVMIKRSSLDKIGKCEDWNTPNALYVDEDWGLRALQLNLPNIWIPQIRYFHYRGFGRPGSTRSSRDIFSHRKRVDILFKNKWGFDSEPSRIEIEEIKVKYSNSLIPWSSYRNSYDWDYNI
jgi:hypothetical protein